MVPLLRCGEITCTLPIYRPLAAKRKSWQLNVKLKIYTVTDQISKLRIREIDGAQIKPNRENTPQWSLQSSWSKRGYNQMRNRPLK